MNRRTFFTSLASLGVAPHPHERLANLVDDASPQYILTKGTRPFSGNAVEIYERWHLFPQQLAVLNEPPRRSIPVLSPRR